MHSVDITPSFLAMPDLTPKKISLLLREHASMHPESADGRMEFVIGQLRIRCAATPTAILAVAEKFDKAKGFRGPRKTKTKISRRFEPVTYSDFCEANELQNAYTYAVNMDISVFFECTHNRLLVDIKEIPGVSDFVSATYFHSNGVKRKWDVYHKLSGLACSSLANSRREAVNKFKNNLANKASERVADLPTSKLNFLSRMHEKYANK